MRETVSNVVEAFHHLYEGLCDRSFCKSLRLDEWTERELAPLVRTFLLGWFGRDGMEPEQWAQLPGCETGEGRIDFVVGGVAVELAVRTRRGSRRNLSSAVNSTEVKKLMKYDGLALLVLFDFSDDPLRDFDIERFRDWPSLGRGPHLKSPFNVSYHYRAGAKRSPSFIKKNISLLS